MNENPVSFFQNVLVHSLSCAEHFVELHSCVRVRILTCPRRHQLLVVGKHVIVGDKVYWPTEVWGGLLHSTDSQQLLFFFLPLPRVPLVPPVPLVPRAPPLPPLLPV